MEKALEILITELTLQSDRIGELENTLRKLKSQLLDIYLEDSVIITIINESLKK
jgi:hypothetical protein